MMVVRKLMTRKDPSILFSYFEAPSIQIFLYSIWLRAHKKGYSKFSDYPIAVRIMYPTLAPPSIMVMGRGKSEKVTKGL